ncbi:MAG: hypothetical protein M3Q81_04260 [bacterium]|nr:hypothetical protein [bacterium]
MPDNGSDGQSPADQDTRETRPIVADESVNQPVKKGCKTGQLIAAAVLVVMIDFILVYQFDQHWALFPLVTLAVVATGGFVGYVTRGAFFPTYVSCLMPFGLMVYIAPQDFGLRGGLAYLGYVLALSLLVARVTYFVHSE